MKISSFLILFLPFFLYAIGTKTGAIPAAVSSFELSRGESTNAPSKGYHLEEKKGAFPGIVAYSPEDFAFPADRRPGFVALCDINADGFDDVLAIYSRPEHYGEFEIFLNQNSFHRSGAALGFTAAQKKSFTVVACADLNNDGEPEIILGGIGQPLLIFKKNSSGKFEQWSMVDSFEELRAINLFDADGDGYLDIYLGNYRKLLPDPNSKFGYTYASVSENRIMNANGGEDRILINQHGSGTFVPLPKSKFQENTHTWAVGISDFNGDGKPDIFVPDNFGQDRFYLNEGNGRFRNNSDESLGHLRSRGSMSAVVADLNDDGLPDIYVSNVGKPGMARGFNSLWMNHPNRPGTFEDVAYEAGVDSCGWSWGAQITDLNQDGYPDIVVVNGLYGAGKSSYWYPFTYIAGIPEFLKRNQAVLGMHPRDSAIAATPKKCIFFGGPTGKFENHAEDTGFIDGRISRGVVAFDYNHDGVLDLLTGNPYEGPVLFTGKLDRPGRWSAVRLKGTKSNATGIGAKIIVVTDKREIRRQYFPLNGYQSQEAGEIFFTFRDGETPREIQVEWPSGIREKQKLSLNTRTTVVERL
jgi:hypothetical protein